MYHMIRGKTSDFQKWFSSKRKESCRMMGSKEDLFRRLRLGKMKNVKLKDSLMEIYSTQSLSYGNRSLSSMGLTKCSLVSTYTCSKKAINAELFWLVKACIR